MKYIALLRGINISGKNKISMAELKLELEKLGYKNVFTYLNSGNVIFDANKSKEELTKEIYLMIKEKFNLDIPIYVTTALELENIINNSPTWWGTDNKDIYDNIIFVISPTTVEEVHKVVGEASKNIDKLQNFNNVIFWSFDLKNYRKSNWWVKTASTSIKDKITIRTANTIKKVLELCNK